MEHLPHQVVQREGCWLGCLGWAVLVEVAAATMVRVEGVREVDLVDQD